MVHVVWYLNSGRGWLTCDDYTFADEMAAVAETMQPSENIWIIPGTVSPEDFD